MSHCSVMTALKMAVCDPQLGKAGLSYGSLLFVRHDEEWERRYC